MLFSKKGKKNIKINLTTVLCSYNKTYTHLFSKAYIFVPFPEDKNHELIPSSKKIKNYVSIKTFLKIQTSELILFYPRLLVT